MYASGPGGHIVKVFIFNDKSFWCVYGYWAEYEIRQVGDYLIVNILLGAYAAIQRKRTYRSARLFRYPIFESGNIIPFTGMLERETVNGIRIGFPLIFQFMAGRRTGVKKQTIVEKGELEEFDWINA